MAFPKNEITFRGHVGKFDQKEGVGEESYKGRQGFEIYTGNFKRDAYNGHSNYFVNSIKRGLWAYNGNFCSNSMEGYGAISYGDATYFAGLFKDDKPFGPGVLTYTNGRQDVGIWNGSQIYRLCISVGYLEKLTHSPQDRIQVAKFKKLIAINEPPRDMASKILMSIGSIDNKRIDPSILYSRFCKNPRSYFYDHQYFKDNLDDLEEIEQSLKEEESGVYKTKSNTLATKFVNTNIVKLKNKQSESSDEEEDQDNESYESDPGKSKANSEEVFILTWNNNPKVIDVMKHSFKHRRKEEWPDFDVGNILCGRRKLFRLRGPKENASIKVLEASGRNDVITILKQMKRHTLNVNVMDNKGNSMFLRAAANDAIEVMQMLYLLGADIDTVNDEGFSALTHTLSRYIALKYDVHNWSHGFLQKKNRYEEFEDTEEHWMDECMLSNFSINRKSMVSLANRRLSRVRKFKKSGSVALMGSMPWIEEYEPRTEYVFEFSPEPRNSNDNGWRNIMDSHKEKRLEVIKNTAFYLLNIGVDIHVSVTPVPVMVLAIFSGNEQIVEKLLKCGADPNEIHNMNNGLLSALHIIAQVRPLPSYPAMVKLFLRYGADPDLRTSMNYNMDEWEYLLEHVRLPDTTVPGLTPLQIIAMRSDATYVTNKEYLEEICCLLSWFSNHKELFLGLSPLGLAISKGNNNIVSTMLNCAKVDVNATFDNFWGNPLFTYLRCHGYKDDPIIMDILRTLILKGAHPLETSVTKRGKGNALNFITQLRERRMVSQSRVTVYGGYYPVYNDSNLRNHEQILMELSKLYLRKYIRGVLVRLHLKFLSSIDSEKKEFLRQMYLHRKQHQVSSVDSIYSGVSSDEDKTKFGYAEICDRTKDWMNSSEECRRIMEKTLENMGDVYNPMQAIRLISLLPNITVTPKKPETKGLKITRFLEGKRLPNLKNFQMPRKNQDDEIVGEEDTLKWIHHFVSRYNANAPIYPELEKTNPKYKVCYRCLKQSATAQSCPICRLVHFCSMKCNLADSKKPDPYHRCAVVFWNLDEDKYFSLQRERSFHKKSKRSLSKKSTSSESTISKSISQISSAVTQKSILVNEKWATRSKGPKPDISDDLISFKKRVRYAKSGKRIKGTKKKGKKRAKAKGKSKMSKKTVSFRYRYPFTAISGEGSELEILGLKEDERNIDKMTTNANIDMAAKLLDKQSHLLELKKLEVDKLKEANQIDVSLLGEIAPPEEFWEKDDEKRVGEKLHTSKQRFMAFLKMLELKFSSFDLEKYLPFIVFVDGVMYFKFYGTETKYKENYSFN